MKQHNAPPQPLPESLFRAWRSFDGTMRGPTADQKFLKDAKALIKDVQLWYGAIASPVNELARPEMAPLFLRSLLIFQAYVGSAKPTESTWLKSLEVTLRDLSGAVALEIIRMRRSLGAGHKEIAPTKIDKNSSPYLSELNRLKHEFGEIESHLRTIIGTKGEPSDGLLIRVKAIQLLDSISVDLAKEWLATSNQQLKLKVRNLASDKSEYELLLQHIGQAMGISGAVGEDLRTRIDSFLTDQERAKEGVAKSLEEYGEALRRLAENIHDINSGQAGGILPWHLPAWHQLHHGLQELYAHFNQLKEERRAAVRLLSRNGAMENGDSLLALIEAILKENERLASALAQPPDQNQSPKARPSRKKKVSPSLDSSTASKTSEAAETAPTKPVTKPNRAKRL